MDNGKMKVKLPIHCSLLIALCSLLLVLCTLFLACRTAPKTLDPFTEPLIPLESGAFAYALVDVKASRPVLDLLTIQGIGDKEKGLILDKMDLMAAALYRPGSERRFQIAAWGDVRPSQGRFIFGANKSWKKMKCSLKHEYWYSPENKMSVALDMRQAYVVQADSDIAPCTHSAGTQVPNDFMAFSRGSVMSCWITEAASFVNSMFDDLGIPLNIPAELIFLSVLPANEKNSEGLETTGSYEMLVRIQTPSATQARSLVRIISMARVLSNNFSAAGNLKPVLEFLLSNELVQDDKYINIKTRVINTQGIALLIDAITVYSKSNNQKQLVL